MGEKLEALAAQCEAATGPDRELDAEIAVTALGFFIAKPRYEGAPAAYGYVDKDGSRIEPGHGGKQLIRDFTGSLDAALSLMPEGIAWRLLSSNEALVYPSMSMTILVRGATPALALCAAALKARRSHRNER